MTDSVRTLLDTLPAIPEPTVRAAALELLDRVSAPLTVRQVERALRSYGVSRSHSVTLANVLRRFTIIAIKEKESK